MHALYGKENVHSLLGSPRYASAHDPLPEMPCSCSDVTKVVCRVVKWLNWSCKAATSVRSSLNSLCKRCKMATMLCRMSSVVSALEESLIKMGIQKPHHQCQSHNETLAKIQGANVATGRCRMSQNNAARNCSLTTMCRRAARLNHQLNREMNVPYPPSSEMSNAQDSSIQRGTESQTWFMYLLPWCIQTTNTHDRSIHVHIHIYIYTSHT